MTLRRAPQRIAPRRSERPVLSPTLAEPAADWLQHLRAVRRLAPLTVAANHRQLGAAIAHLEPRITSWGQLRAKHVEGLKPESVRMLGRFIDYLVAMSKIPLSPMIATPAPFRPYGRARAHKAAHPRA